MVFGTVFVLALCPQQSPCSQLLPIIMRSALNHPSVIDAYLETEVSCGRVAGPFTAPPFPDLHVSGFGVVPKSYQPGKWCLILDLSSPDGHSVNDGIPKSPFSVQYVTVDSFIDGIMARGRSTLMVKFDVARAYRNVAIHPLDHPLLEMKWREKYYVDMDSPVWASVSPLYFYGYCGHGPVDADFTPWH